MTTNSGRRFAVAALILLAAWTCAAIAQDTDAMIREAVAAVSLNEVIDDALVLTGHLPYDGELIESRDVDHPDHALAMDFLIDRIGEMGFDAEIESFSCGGDDCANLVVELPGAVTPERIWIAGAHFDSTNGADPADPAEGAVDNASGVVIVLQALAALSSYEFADTIRFILFDAEEIGLVGSAYHAGRARELGEQIVCMLNYDVAGWRTQGLNAAFANSDEATWPYLERMTHIPERYETGTSLIGVPTDLIDSADMASFWDEGYAALMVGSLYGITGWMNTGEDTYDKLDTEQCANVARILVAYLGEEAVLLGLAPPDDDDSGDDDDADDDDDDDTGDDDAGDDDAGDDDDDDDDEGCAC